MRLGLNNRTWDTWAMRLGWNNQLKGDTFAMRLGLNNQRNYVGYEVRFK